MKTSKKLVCFVLRKLSRDHKKMESEKYMYQIKLKNVANIDGKAYEQIINMANLDEDGTYLMSSKLSCVLAEKKQFC